MLQRYLPTACYQTCSHSSTHKRLQLVLAIGSITGMSCRAAHEAHFTAYKAFAPAARPFSALPLPSFPFAPWIIVHLNNQNLTLTSSLLTQPKTTYWHTHFDFS